MPPDLIALIESGQFVGLVRFPGYGVSTDGRVWSCWKHAGRKPAVKGTTWKEKKRTIVTSGYFVVNLGRNKITLVHRLVLEAFVGPCPPGMLCCHRNHDRADPRLENLRWDTQKGNIGDSVNDDRMPRSENSYAAKLTNAQVAEIRAFDFSGTPRRIVAARYGVVRQTIDDILNFRRRKRG